MSPFTTAPSAPPSGRPILILGGAGLVGALLLAAVTRRIVAAPISLAGVSPWLVVHLATVIPALPLGAFILAARKGDRRHRALGRVWASLMLIAAISSFGLQSSGHLSWIHILSTIVLISVPRAVLFAMRGDIRRHQRIMRNVYLGLVIAGLFVFVPGRLFGGWLFGG